MIKVLIAVILISGLFQPIHAKLIELKYDRWTLYYNCEKRGYEWFHYTTIPDTGSLERHNKFYQESRLPQSCRQFSTWSYKTSNSLTQYDRGHGVHQNINDHDLALMIQTNSMANIVPHAKKLNRFGVWRTIEKITECHRDNTTVEVWGGNIWGNNASNDHFLYSHGVVTPDFLWKVILINGEANAWIMPNSDSAKNSKMDSYLVSPKTITKYTGVNFPSIPRSELSEQDAHSIRMPKKCSLK